MYSNNFLGDIQSEVSDELPSEARPFYKESVKHLKKTCALIYHNLT